MKRTYHRWTPAEDKILREMYASVDTLVSQLHRLPGCNEMGCKNRARVLGIRKSIQVRETSKPQVVAAMAMYRGLSAPDIAKRSKIHIVTVRKLLSDMVKAGEAHIAAWGPDKTNGVPTRLYRLGSGRNASKPRVRTSNERVKAWEQRQEPEELRVRRSRYYTRRQIKLGVLIPPRDPITAALFGSV